MSYPNGILIQSLCDKTSFVRNFNYHGIFAYNLFPLCCFSDKACIELTRQQQSKADDNGMFLNLEFISDFKLYERYVKKCKEMKVPIRALFIESDYNMEIWEDSLPPMRFLGYEYCPIPIDEQVITDIDWYKPFSKYWIKFNEHGLFCSYDDATEFAKEYESAVSVGDIGDDLEDAFIFRVSELQIT